MSHRKANEQVLLEPSYTLNNRNLAVAKCMVKLHKFKSRPSAYMSIINPTTNSVFLGADTVLAPIHDVYTNEVHPLTEEVDKNGSLSATCFNTIVPVQDKTNISFDLSKSDLNNE